MKLKSIALSIFLLTAALPAAAQEADSTATGNPHTTVAEPWVEPLVTSKIHLMTRAYGDSIVLRWVAEDFTSYNYLARLGVNVLRVPRMQGGALVGDSVSLPEFRIDTLAYGLRPLTLDQFRQKYAANDSNAYIAMGLLYGEKENYHKNKEGFADQTQNLSSDQDISYGFAMLVADWRTDLATDMAVRFTDKTAERGRIYDYYVQPTVWENNGKLIFEPGVVENVKNEPYEPQHYEPRMVDSLSTPYALVLGWWDKDHSSFEVERRHRKTLSGKDVNDTWHRVTRRPYVPMVQQSEDEDYCLIHDTVPELGMWDYRVFGYDPFGELTPPAEHNILVRDVEPPIPASIKLILIERPDDSDPMAKVTAHITWEKDTLEQDLEGYRIFYRPMRSSDTAPWQPLNFNLIAPSDTLFSVDMTGKRTGMIYIAAYDQVGNESKSFMQQIRLTDFKAPQTPSNLRAVVREIDLEKDTAQLRRQWAYIDLFWQPSPEDDDIDYFDIAFANDSTHDFLVRNEGGIRQSTYTDSVSLNANQKYIYYKVRAIDWSTNVGEWSPWIQVLRPHATPPTVPHLGKSDYDEQKGIHMEWIVGRDADMQQHTLYRRLGEEGEAEVIGTWNADSVKLDSCIIHVTDNPPHSQRERYYYWMTSTNSSPFVSKSLAVSWRHLGPRVFDVSIDLSGSYRQDTEQVVLDWSFDEKRLPGGDWYWAVFRRGPGEKGFSYYMAVDKTDHVYTEHALKPGEEADYYVRLQFGDGRRSQESKRIHVAVPKKE